jgi:hypothetical protein
MLIPSSGSSKTWGSVVGGQGVVDPDAQNDRKVRSGSFYEISKIGCANNER